MKSQRLLDPIFTVACLGNHLEIFLGLQEGSQPGTDYIVVIYK